MANTQIIHKGLRTRLTGMLVILFLQYLAGMTINLFGSDDPAKRPLAANIAFFAHLIFAAMILVGAIFIFVFSRKSGDNRLATVATHGLYSVLAAIAAGIATLLLKDTFAEFTSLVMALSFLYAFASYGYLYLLVRGDSIKVVSDKK